MRRDLITTLVFSALVLAVDGYGAESPPRARLADVDQRKAALGSVAAASADQQAAAEALRSRLPRAQVEFDEVTGAPKLVSAGEEFLSGPAGQGKAIAAATVAGFAADDPYRATKAFLLEHNALFGHGPEVLPAARVQREFVTPHNGLKTVVWEQQVDGIAVFEGVLVTHTTKGGELVNLASGFVPEPERAAERGTPGRAALETVPGISAPRALTLAVQNIGEQLSEENITPVDSAVTGPERHQKFVSATLKGEAETKLIWLPMNRNELRLCWDVVLMSRERGEMYRVLLDVRTGEVLLRRCLTVDLSDATYRVYTSDSPSPFSPGYSTPVTTQPPLVARTLVTLSALDTNASPNGWIDDGVNETRGNNVDAHTDWDNNNVADVPRPQGSPLRVFDFPLDLTQAPHSYSNAVVVQLFYWNNWMHDKLYELGFTEAAGNFQNNNFGRGGLGNDAVQADAQDGGGYNNANFSTPPDGSAGRMQMYIFNGPVPNRDGDLDAEVVLHEYTHGLSNRRVGGGVGISALQTGGMGEGWSDFYAMTELSESGDDVNSVYATGGYATYQLSGMTQNYYFGIRRYPYCTDMSKNPLTFKDIDPGQASTHTGSPRSPIIGTTANEVHNMGEVWCMTLWEARANLVNKYGWAVGNQLILQLVTDGMNLSPANPNFLQARDAILQADQVDNGGANRNELWAAFAKRGMGVTATSPASSTTTGVHESFDVPDDLQVLPAVLFASGSIGGPFTPNPGLFVLTNTGGIALSWSLLSTSVWLTISPPGGTLTPGGAASVSVSIDAVANSFPHGIYNSVVWFTNQTSGVVQSRTFALGIVGWNMFDDFDPGIDLSQWSSFGGVVGSTVIATNYGGYISSPNSLWFGDAGSRFATTLPINTSSGGNIAFYIRLANGGAWPWEQADYLPYEGVVLEASANNGTNWTALGNYDTTAYYSWTAVTLAIPPAARGPSVQFRWRQKSHSGSAFDHWALDNVTIDAVQPVSLTLTIPTTATEGDGVLTGTVTVSSAPTNDLEVALNSSDTTEVTVAATVTILSGQNNAVFSVTVVDDAELDGTQNATITASASGYASGNASIAVYDNETATLTVVLPAAVTEGQGTVTGTVQVSAVPAANISVGLSSSDTTEIQVPASVLIPAGQTSAVFTATVVDDTQIDGDQTATVTAHVPNWTDGQAAIVVHDNEATNLVVMLPASAREGDGVLVGAGRVRIAGTLPTDLVVSLLSSDTTELTVPPTSTILAGQTSAAFNLTIVDDPEVDGSQNVTVTADASGFAPGLTNMTVTDNESPFEPFNPSPAHLATNVIQTTSLSWQSGALPGEVITNDVYFGTNPTPGPAELLGTTTNTTWILPTLAPQTTYYWQIIAWKAGVTPGPVWQFTTRGVDHFVWDTIPSPQYVSQPFTVTVTAKDAFNATVSNFTGTVNLTAGGSGSGEIYRASFESGLQAFSVSNSFGLGNGLWHLSTGRGSQTGHSPLNSIYYGMGEGPSGGGTYNSGVANEGIIVSPVIDLSAATAPLTLSFKCVIQSEPGTSWDHATVEVSTNNGASYVVVASNNQGGTVFGTDSGGAWIVVTNNFSSFAGQQVRLRFHFNTIDAGANNYEGWYVDDIVISGQEGGAALPSSPTNSTAFTDGVWSGPLSIQAPGSNVVMRADDANGHIGSSNPFDVALANDLSVSIAAAPTPVTVGSNLTYTLTIANTGPSAATGVIVTNLLPASATFISATATQGTSTQSNGVVMCDVGTVLGGTNATISIVVVPTTVGTTITNLATVSRAEVDPYVANNAAIATTVVNPPCTPSPAGLISWWRGDGDGTDFVGGNDGTLVNGVVFVLGEVGQAFQLNGVNQLVIVSNSPSLNPTSAITLEGWVYATGYPATDFMYIACKDGENVDRQYLLEMGRNGNLLFFRPVVGTPSGLKYFNGTTLVALNTWNHVAMTYDGSQLKLYVNGNLDGSLAATGPITTSAQPFRIGRGAAPSGLQPYYFPGRVDELSLYDHALTISEIQAIYNANVSGKCAVPIPPFISLQPTNVTVFASEMVTLAVVAGGAPPLSCQWRTNGTDLAGATNSVLVLTNVQLSQAGTYMVQVSNAYGLTNSAAAVLTVNPAPACAALPAGLVSWWRGEGNALDSAGGNHGTLAGNTTYGAGRVGQGFVLDGNGDAVQVGNPVNLQLQDFTIEAWVKRASATVISYNGGFGMLFAYGAGGYCLFLDNSGHPTIGKIGASSVTSTASITDTNFHHVAVSKSGSTVVFYADGVAYPVGAYNPGFTFTTTARIGADSDSVENSFLGTIDEMSIYNRALSSGEVQAVYNANLTGKCPLPPRIVTQPTNQTVFVTETVTLAVVAGGTPPLSYQWRTNGTDLAGATNSILVLTNVQLSQAGSYMVQISNSVGSTNSAAAVLTVSPPPPCVAPPAGLVSWWRGEGNTADTAGGNNGVLAGNTTYGAGRVGQGFVLDGNGDAVQVGNPVNLQLQDFTIEAWVKRASATVISYNGGFGMLFAYGAGGYCLFLDNSGHPTIGKIGTSSVSASGAVTDTAFHHVAVSKSGSTVVFYVDGVAYPAAAYDPGFTFTTTARIGADSDSVENSFLGTIDEMSIYNRALSTVEVQAIHNASVTGKCMSAPPVITFQPTNQTVLATETVTLAVVAGGTPPLSYQWRTNGMDLAGATNSILILTNVQLGQAGSYVVQVSNPYGLTNSAAAVLTVNPAPACAASAAGLVSWWRGEGNTADTAGGNNGVLAGNTTYGAGRVGQGFVLDGNGDAVQVGNPVNLQLQDFTIETWVKRASSTVISYNGDFGMLFAYGAGGYGLYLDTSGHLTFGQIGVSSVTSTASITETNFHHVAVSKSGSTVVFYVDGVAYPVGAYNPGFTFTTTARLGADADNLENSFLGTIDEMSIYNRALSSGEVQAVYNANLTGKCPLPPRIVTQPTNQTVFVTETVTLVVVAGGTPPLSYQWRTNGTDLAGATNSILVLTNVQLSQAGSYMVQISNGVGSTNSAAAVLTVSPPPPCVAPPAGLVSWWRGEGNTADTAGGNNGVLAGNTTYGAGRVGQGFVLDGNGDAVQVGNPVNLQLQDFTIETWVKRASSTVISYNGGLGMLFAYGAGGYGLYLDGSGHPTLSRIGVDNVTVSAAITDTSFHHVAVSKSGSTVVFYVDGVAYPAAAYDPGFTFTTPAAIGAVGDNLNGSLFGTIDEMSIYDRALSTVELQAICNASVTGKCMSAPPVITFQPTNQTVLATETVTLAVVAGGTPPLSYQWRTNGMDLAGATNSILILTNVQLGQAGSYVVQVSNPYGLTNSAAAVLTVNPAPACAASAAGLVSWWRGEGNTADTAGGNNGVLAGNTTYGAGRVGQGFVLDGNGDAVQVGNPVNLQLQDFTIETWVKRASSTVISYNGDFGMLFAYGAGGYGLYLDTSGHLTFGQIGVSSVTSTASITETNFHHVAVSKSGSTVVFYVDGVAYPVGAYNPGFTFTTTARLGADADNLENSFLGTIDEMSIYNRALSSGEVQAVYNANLTGKCPLPPRIVTQPTNQTVFVTETVTLVVVAGGTPPLSYQWRTNGTDLAGATNSILVLTNVQLSQAGSYMVQISNGVGSTNSAAAVLTVSPPPPCVAPPAGLVSWWRGEGNTADTAGGNNGVLAGNTTYGAGRVGQGFVLDGNGDAVQVGNPVNLQLQDFTIETWVKRASSTVISYNGGLGMLFAYGAGGYCLFLDNSGHPTIGKIGTSSVTSTASITDTNFHHVAVSKSGSTVVFYVDGVTYPVGAYNPGFTFTTTARIGADSDSVENCFLGTIDEISIYNRALSTVEVQVIYNASFTGKCTTPIVPYIITQPTNQTVVVGEPAAFTVLAGGTWPLSYQWSFNTTNLPGATNSALVLTNLQFGQAGSYVVQVSNGVGSTNSAAAVLTVNPPPACVAPAAGLVSWWRGEGNALDSAEGNHGTLAGNTTYGAGRVGQGFVLDGNGDAVQVGNPVNLQLQDFTIEAWVKRASATVISYNGGFGMLFAYGAGGYCLFLDNSGHPTIGKIGTSSVSASGAVTDTAFHHVAVSKSGSTVVFYVDGVAYPAAAYDPGFTFTTTARIGADSDSVENSFLGTIDEMSIYDRALSTTEIQAIYTAIITGKCTTAPPVITLQPTNVTVFVSETVALTVGVGGKPPFSYQWNWYGTNLDGATNNPLVLTNVQLSQSGSYAVQVSNAYGLTNSAAAVLTVNPPPPCIPPPSGIISWWRGDGNVIDASGGNNGTLVGNTTYGAGRVGQGFVLDGNGDAVRVGNPVNLQLQDFTIETWVKRASSTVISYNGGLGMLFAYGAGGYGLYLDGGGNPTLSWIGINNVAVSAAITDTSFHHVAVTKSGSTVVFYVDGVSYPAAPYNPGFTFTAVAAIGAMGDDPGNNFLGTIDELSIYNQALSTAELQSIYNASLSGKCPLPPRIVTQPTNQTVYTTETVTLAVVAGGTPPLSYQWRTNGMDLAGATNSILILTNVQLGQAGSYVVQVSNAYGLTNSAAAVLTVIPPPPCAETAAGLVSWWRGEGNTADTSGGNNGTLVGNTTYGAGRVGQGFVLDGNGDAVQIGKPANLRLQDFTIETWVKRGSASAVSGASGALGMLFACGVGGYGLYLDTSGHPALSRIGVDNVTVGVAITDTTFHHLAVSKSGSTVVFYIDGVAYPAAAYNPTFTFTTTVRIGADSDSVENSFLGTIDEMSIYNRALSTAEVQTIYNASFNGKCTTPIVPRVFTQPTNQAVVVGGGVTFAVLAGGEPPLSYQWNFNGTDISGATSASLTLANVQPTNAGNYAVVVTNNWGSVTSAVASLTVVVPPSILTPPQSQTVNQGSDATFSVVATGTEPLSYKWRFNGTNIAGAAGNNYTRVNVQAAVAGNYSVIVTNLAGSATSAVAVLTVLIPPVITTQPQSQTMYIGGPVSFSVAAVDTGPFGYQWRFKETDIPGATTSSLTISNVQMTNRGNFSVVVTNTQASVVSSNAFLAVVPVAAWGDETQNDVPGDLTNVTAVASGDYLSLALQPDGTVRGWYHSGYPVDPVPPPAVPAGLTNVVAIAAGSDFSLALKSDRTVVGGGANGLGGGSVPLGLSNVVAIAAGSGHALAVKSDGTVVGWGDDSFGQTDVPAGLNNVVKAAAGFMHSLALKADGTVVGWGDDSFGQTDVPAGLSNVVEIAVGYLHSLALRSDGTVVGWGLDDVGETDVPVGLSNVVAIAGGAWHSLVLKNDGTLLAWGDNSAGQTGLPTGLSHAMGVAGGGYHSVALVGSVPWFLIPPQSQTVVQGANATFSVVAGGTPPLSYQWQFNGTNLTGASADTLALVSVQTNQVGDYAVVVTNAWGSVTSALASLTVVVPPSISTQPTNQTVVQGANATFSVVAGGTPPLSYQWQFNGTNLTGASADTLTLVSVQANQVGDYAVVVTNAWGSITSAVASLMVVVPPSISTQPTDQTVVQGSNATFSVVAGGTAPLSYQWQFNGTNLTGASTDTLALVGVQTDQAGDYAVMVTNDWGSVTSAVASLTVVVPPSILTPPQSQTVVQGSNATFSVAAIGTAPLSYQWNFNGAIIDWTTNAFLSLSNVQSGDAGSYWVAVSNTVGTTNSAAAILTVISRPELRLPFMTGDGTFSFMLSGDPGSNYLIEVTTDFVSWTSLTTLSNETGQVPFTDTNATGTASSFYRARLLP